MLCFSRAVSVMRAARTGLIDISWVSGTLQQQRLRYTKHCVLQGLLRILKGGRGEEGEKQKTLCFSRVVSVMRAGRTEPGPPDYPA